VTIGQHAWNKYHWLRYSCQLQDCDLRVEGYTVSLQTGNYENDLHGARDAIFDTDDHEAFISSSVYTDVNGERQDPNVRMIDTLREVVTRNGCGTSEGTPAAEDVIDGLDGRRGNIPTISYTIHGQVALINSWEDPTYFTATFPTLFLTGTGGHQDKRAVPVSLAAFVEWALNHHSGRQAALIH
jgi:hypothetical protein